MNGTPSVGREAVRATAAAFMESFPDMRVTMDSIVGRNGGAVFYWRWTGTNTGPERRREVDPLSWTGERYRPV